MADGKIVIDAKISTAQAEKSARALKAQAEAIAKEYQKQGATMEDAMEKAWRDIESDARKGAKNTRNIINDEFTDAAADMKRTLSGIGGMFMSVFGTVSVVSLAKECIELGSAVEEVQNVVDTAFGSMAYKMEEFSEKAITSYGMSQLAAKKTGSNFMAMARGMGIAEGAASDMAIALTALSGDVASFYNITQEEAVTKLKSVFTGETETLKELGVVMTQANLEQYALNKGITKGVSAMSQAEVTALRYSYVLDSLGMASGDFVRTQDSWANQTRILSEQMKQLGANIGTILTTVLLPAVKTINQIVAGLVSATNAVVAAINTLFGKQTEQNNSIASSAGAAADAENDLADGITAAGQAAKKYLASFDEINRLGGDEDGSSAAGGSFNFGSISQDGSVDVGEITVDGKIKDNITPQIKALAEQIHSLGLTINNVFFDWDDLTGEQIAEKVVTGLIALVGAGVGFLLGGIPGALKGTLVGLALGVGISSIIFNNDGSLSADEIVHALIVCLGAIGGGIIGFALGGRSGATIGAAIGLGLAFALTGIVFDKDGKLSDKEMANSLIALLSTIGGGLIGFFAGGPAGAAIGASIGLGLSFFIAGFDFSKESSSGKTFAEDIIDNFNLQPAVDSAFIQPTKTDLNNFGAWVSEKFKGISGNIIDWFENAGTQSDANYIQPSKKDFKNLGDWINSIFEKSSGRIIDSFDLAAQGTDSGFIVPTQTEFESLGSWVSEKFRQVSGDIVKWFENAGTQSDANYIQPTKTDMANLGDWISQKLRNSSDDIIRSFNEAGSALDSGFTTPTRADFEATGSLIGCVFTDAKNGIVQGWNGLCTWFDQNVFTPIETGFKNMVNGSISLLNGLIEGVEDAINWCVRALNNFSIDLPDWDVLGDMAGGTFGFSLKSVSFNQIPYLAQGAVIPPNREFLAVLGDQKHGTNIEAPLATIQEAVAIVMEDMVGSQVAGFEAVISVLREILEAILGIEIDGETLAKAVESYQRKMAVVRGG